MKKKKKDKLSLCKSSRLFCLKGSEGSSPLKRRQAAEPRVWDQCCMSGLFYQCTFNGTETATISTIPAPVTFFFFLYLGKMSIGCFYVLWPVSHKMWHDRGFLFYLFPAVYHLGAGKDALWLSLVRYTSICAPIVRNWEGYWEWCLSVGGVDWCMKPNLKYPVDYVRTSRKERIHHYLCFHFLQSLCVIFFFKEDGV